VTDARDAIQFLWDQTVRGINNGLTLGELIAQVQLPARFERSYLTQQHYGLAEHHVRQIHAGLRGWFDGYEAELFPLPTQERARRMIDGFGGRSAVAAQATSAMSEGDLRWALELATWLVRSETGPDGRADGGSDDERALLASVLRLIGQRTTAANIRNWCLTRALELENKIHLDRLRGYRASRGQVLSQHPASFVHGLKVILEPSRAAGVHTHVGFDFGNGPVAGLLIRGGVAVPTDGSAADHVMALDLATWADMLVGSLSLVDALAGGRVAITGDAVAARAAMACFDHPSFAP
jgi:alkyl sulfatase BDS1-like metallo-beta-lactamase superfamily hydrolase